MASPLKSYGRIDEADQVSLDARLKTRKRVAIIAVSTLLLVAIIVVAAVGGATSHKGSDSAGRGPPSLSTSVKAVCDMTLYPTTCYDSLSPVVNSTSLDPSKLLQLSVQVAMHGVAKAAERLEEMGAGESLDKMSSPALSNCKELLALAVDHLNDTVSPADLTSAEVVDDLKTWLSAAVTNLQTCIDGFEGGGGGGEAELKGKVAAELQNSTQFTSNSLAILTAISNFVGNLNLSRRRLMSYDVEAAYGQGEYPSWLLPSDRKLLESSGGDPRWEADAVVAKDGSGKYRTIGAALAGVPEKKKKRFVIYVKKGVYYENVRVEKNKWNVMMVGDGMEATVVSGSLNFVDGTPTFSSATFAVFGKGFVARDMGFRNTAGAAKQQAVALMSNSDQSVFYRCLFDAFQDTLYAHSLRQFYRECHVYGTVDFIFGNAAALLQSCSILPRPPLPGQPDTLTAQGKVDPNQNTGISIHNSTVWPAGDLSSVRVFLGRPWKPYSTTVFLATTMAGVVDPAGWMPWTGTSAPDTIFYGEYQNYGPGAATKGRVKWKGLRHLTPQQAKKFTVGGFLGSKPSWIAKAGVPYNSGL